MPTFLERYLRGEYEQVWDDLYADGAPAPHGALLEDALAVAQETMRRVRGNIQLLIPRLEGMGYRFGVYPHGRTPVPGYSGPYHPPRPGIARQIAEFERLDGVGALPLSLKVFWEVVGDVDFMGTHPLWPEYSDPLVVYPLEAAKTDYEDWLYMLEEGEFEMGPFGVPLAPDFFHKDNVSGGAPYELHVPNPGMDGIVENERQATPFVNYLRVCFRCGGFPGVQWSAVEIPQELRGLAEGLMPI